MTIQDIQDRDDLQLVVLSQDVEQLNTDMRSDYDSYFIKIHEGEVVEAYGFYGNIPYLNKTLERILF